MINLNNPHSRYALVATRSMLARRAAIGALVLAPTLAACGPDDAAVFETVTTDVAEPAASDPALTPVTEAVSEPVVDDSVAPDTSVPETAVPETAAPETTGAETTVAEAVAETTVVESATFPESAELLVNFTFAPSDDGGRIHNPYIAVWVEDAEGNLVRTVSLWYEQSEKGNKWLKDLLQWASVSGQAVDETTSGATRVAGDNTVAWDGTDADGELVAQGDYVLYIEASREKGPYELTSTPLTIGADGFTVELADNGELTNASAELVL